MLRVVLVSHIHGMTERHLRARANWPNDAILRNEWGRDAREIGNDRPLPFLKDLLKAGLESGADVVVWLNDDCSLSEDAFSKMARHCQVFFYGCVRRDPTHCGRECFFFLSSWLREHLSQMPDVILSAAKCDLAVARWLHKLRGYHLHEKNLLADVFPTEVAPGLVHHAQHLSSWPGDVRKPAALHNAKLWDQMK